MCPCMQEWLFQQEKSAMTGDFHAVETEAKEWEEFP